MERIKGKYRVDPDSGCWNWTASRLSSGYGQAVRLDAPMRSQQGKPAQEGAHRVSYKIFHGDVPQGKVVRHACNNKICINPDHLLIGTQKDNMADYALIARPRKRDDSGRFVCHALGL